MKQYDRLYEVLKSKGLSNRECEVAHLVSKGLSNKETGVQLFVTEKTVKFHLSNIYKKLGITTRAQLVVFCLEYMSYVDSFKAGDTVKFKGITVGEKKIKSVTGVLKLSDKNTTYKGVMSIEGDEQGMLFNPDGTIYCHQNLGILLERAK